MKLFGKIIMSFALALGVFSGAYAARAGVPMELFLNNPIPTLNAPNTPAKSKVEDAIARAGALRNWVISKNADGTLNARLSIRTHSLDVTIKLHDNQYDILYKGSVNLGYAPNPENPGQPMIHPNVSRWIRALISDINAQLAALNY